MFEAALDAAACSMQFVFQLILLIHATLSWFHLACKQMPKQKAYTVIYFAK